MIVLDKSGLKITFKLERPPDIPDLLVINMLAQNFGNVVLTDFLFQAAVPRVRRDTFMCISTLVRSLITRLIDTRLSLADIPTTDVVAVEYCHSAVWSSNSSAESHKHEQSQSRIPVQIST